MITQKHLLDIVAKKKGFGRYTLEYYTNCLLMEIAEQLKKGETVDLGEFGQFKPSAVKEHVLSFNSKVTVPAHTKITFSNSDILKGYINDDIKLFKMETKKPPQ